MAADMRAVIKSALRLPFDEDRIVDILRDCERGTADDSDDEDHTTFWLVLADQFEKRGVAHAPARAKAIAIIDRGDDLDMMEKRGMKQADLRKRGARLAELRARLAAAPRASRPARRSRRRSLTFSRSASFTPARLRAATSIPVEVKRTSTAPPGFPTGGGNSSFSIVGALSIILPGISRWCARSRSGKSRASPMLAPISGGSSTRLTHAHDAISTIWKSTRSGPCRSTWKRRRRDSGKPGRLSSTSAGMAAAPR